MLNVSGNVMDGLSLGTTGAEQSDWAFNAFDDVYQSPLFDDWQTAMDVAVRLGVGRKTSESGTYTLDPGVEIKAVKTDV